MDYIFHDLDDVDLTHVEGLAEIDGFFSPKPIGESHVEAEERVAVEERVAAEDITAIEETVPAPETGSADATALVGEAVLAEAPVPAEDNLAIDQEATAGGTLATEDPAQSAEQDATALETDDEFAGLMGDIDTIIPDAPHPAEAQGPTASLDHPFTGSYAPATPSFLAPGPSATSIFQNRQLPYSPDLPPIGAANFSQQLPPTPFQEGPSSGNRSLMQAEMRHEEDLQKSPLPATSGQVPRFTLDSNLMDSAAMDETPIGDENFYTPNERAGQSRALEKTASTRGANKLQQEEATDGVVAAQDVAVPASNTEPTQLIDDNTTTANPKTTAPPSPQSSDQKNAKRRRKSTPQAMPARKDSKSDDTSAQPPPAKKSKPNASKKKATKPEAMEMAADEDPKSQANEATASKPAKSIEENESSLSELSSEQIEQLSESLVASGKSTADSEEPTAAPKPKGKAKGKGKAKKSAEKVSEEENLPEEQEDINTTAVDKEADEADEAAAGKADTPVPAPKKQATKSKAKSKAKVTEETPATGTKRGKSASTEPAAATPAKKQRVGGQELKSLIGNSVMKGVRKMEASPRKTRRARKDEEDAKPNAANAVQRRRSGAGK